MQRLELYKNAVAHSLQSRPELNGQLCYIVGYNEEKGRYAVQIKGETISVLPSNLRESGLPVGVVLPFSQADPPRAPPAAPAPEAA